MTRRPVLTLIAGVLFVVSIISAQDPLQGSCGGSIEFGNVWER